MYQNAFNCEAFHLPQITTTSEVRLFADYLVNGLNVNIHPDTPFEDYIAYADGTPTFCDEDIKTGNRLMDECFEVCEAQGEDVYGIMCDVLFERLLGHKKGAEVPDPFAPLEA